jgi:hypothetical protein
MTEPTPGALWSQYVDWCSARIAARFLELSSDQIWELADRQRNRASQGVETMGAPPTDPLRPDSGYVDLVRQVTLDLFAEMNLPDFHAWQAKYVEKGTGTENGDVAGLEAASVPDPE